MNIISIFLNMKVHYVFSLESPHRGDPNVYTQYTIIYTKKKNILNYPKYIIMPAAIMYLLLLQRAAR